MGLLMPIVHPERLPAPREVAALYEALGVSWVDVSGWKAADPAIAAQLTAAAVPGNDSTISFVGELTAAALPALGELAHAVGTGYLDIGVPTGSLRVWPDHSWATRWDQASRIQRVWIETPDVALALRMFELLTERGSVRGFIHGPGAIALARLPAFVAAIGATVDADLLLAPAAAAALIERVPDQELEWQASDTMVSFPGGEISTYLLYPVDQGRADAWLATISEALTVAARSRR